MTSHLAAVFRLGPTMARHRFLLRQLAWRAFASRHAGSYLGWLWTPVATAVLFGLYVVVFSVILDLKVEGLGIDVARKPLVGFGVFLMTGLVPFLAINDCVLRAARVVRAHAALVQRVRMPLEVLVLGDAVGTLMHHAVSFVVVLAVCVALGHLSLATVPWLAAGIGIAALWIAGACLLVAALGALIPDLSEGLALGLQVLFYGAPIIYPLTLVPEGTLRSLVEVNPMTPLVGVMRAGLLGTTPPDATTVIWCVVLGLALLVAGVAVIDRFRATIPDLI
jgi:lipopolysaccharide transport system permease protein